MKTGPLLKLIACAALALGSFTQAFAAEGKGTPNGTWTWTTPARGGNEGRTATLKLKAEGEKLTGKISTPGRQGRVNEVDITDGKFKDGQVSFTVVRDTQNGKMTQKFAGKLAGDTIKGTIEVDRDGNSRSRDWEAKRQ